MTDIRKKAEKVLSAVPAFGQQINSIGVTAKDFTRMTGGVTQADLDANWNPPTNGKRTTCNEFVGWYAAQLGSKKYLGRFDVQTFLSTIGKGHAWVTSAKGRRPKYGDIYVINRTDRLHMGISLDFEGDIWAHADSGQGGKKYGYDVIKRTRDAMAFDFSNIDGWIDLDLYFSDNLPVPDWLLGWWRVKRLGQTFYYYFDPDHNVTSANSLPLTPTTPPAGGETGAVTIKIPELFLTIQWDNGTAEEFQRTPEKMTALSYKAGPPRYIDTLRGTRDITVQVFAEKVGQGKKQVDPLPFQTYHPAWPQ